MVTLQHRDTLPTGVLFANIGLCSCWVFSKQGTLVSHGSLADLASQVLMRRCRLPHTWTGGEASQTSACRLHTHLNGHLRREGRRCSWREVGKEGQTAPLRGRQQAQMFAAVDGRRQQSRPQHPWPAGGKEREREAGQCLLELRS